MPWGLKRYQDTGDLHFITFSCYQRLPFLAAPSSRRVVEEKLEHVRRWYGLLVKGYVIMPEHVHLLVSEPERSTLAVAIQMLKQITAQKLRPTLSPTDGEKGGAPGKLATRQSLESQKQPPTLASELFYARVRVPHSSHRSG